MKKIIITNAFKMVRKERIGGLMDIEIDGLEKEEDSFNAMQISDGFHTFDELYEHRNRLFIALCDMLVALDKESGTRYEHIWCSTKHSDGSSYEDWFILGIGKEINKQISYHLPAKYWNEVCEFAQVLEKAPEWDGHTSDDVLERLKNLCPKTTKNF